MTAQNTFISSYAIYVNHCIKANLLSEEKKFWCLLKTYNSIKGWKINKLTRTSYAEFGPNYWDSWTFHTDDYYCHLRAITGLVSLSYTDREIKINDTPCNIIGGFYPINKDLVFRINDFMDIGRIFGWHLTNDAFDNYDF